MVFSLSFPKYFRLISNTSNVICSSNVYRFNTFVCVNSRNLDFTARKMNKANPKKLTSHAVVKVPPTYKNSAGSIPNIADEYEVLKSPIKSFSDKKEYKVIRLKNGLTACVISDTLSEALESDSESETDSQSGEDNTSSCETDSESSSGSDDSTSKAKDEVKLAAAALCVGVGSFSDPKEVPGLAHFLEHMVFMGSEKFPQENDFDAFITKHGGSDNGSTDYEVTTFYFECFEKHLFPALDKFSQFFISPLMKKDSLSREREAVESEFQMAVPSDDNRIEQLLLSLSQKSSPINSFSWGNLVSLKDNISEEELYEKLHEFRKRHYSAHRMTLAIQARLPLDTLVAYVVDCFSSIPTNNLPPENFSLYTDNVFNTPEFAKLYYVKPAKNTCQVTLNWAMPSLLYQYKSKPHEYVSWLIGHEGRGSLLSYLKNQLWAFYLRAGTGTSGADLNSLYTLFSVTIILTEKGYELLDQVIEAVFSYIKLLRDLGPSEQIFKEIQITQDLSFRFDEEENPSDIVEEIVENMQIYPPEDYLIGSELFFEYSPQEIIKVINYLIPTKVNIMVLSTTIPDSIRYDKIEPWFKISYTDQVIPDKWLERWKNVEPLPCFKLPEPNQFLTQDFSIVPKGKNYFEYPQKIMDTSLIELWYKKDEKFGLPVAYYYYYLFSPLSVESTRNTCMMQIFVLILNMNLMEEGYPAKLADLSYYIYAWESGIWIKVVGYNEKLPILIQLIAKYLKNCATSFDKVLFETARGKEQQNVYNTLLKPSKLCNDLRSSILQKRYFLLLDKYSTLSEITYDMMKEFAQHVLDRLYIQSLIQGNLTADTALTSTKILLDELNFGPIETVESLRVQVNKIPKGEHCCRVFSLDKNNINSTITNYYQYGPLTIKDNVILDFILLLLEEPLFNTLRTKEQLGYSIFSTIRDTYGILGYSITVQTQADKYTPRHIDNRIEEFIKSSRRILKKMTNKKFNQTKDALTKTKQVVDVDLEDEVDRNWEEIIYKNYKFNRLELEIKEIQKLKIAEIVKWWDTCNNYNKKNNSSRKLTTQVVGHVKGEIEENAIGSVTVESPCDLISENNKLIQLDSDHSTQIKRITREINEQETVVINHVEMVSSNDTTSKNISTRSINSAKKKLALHFINDPNEKSERNILTPYFITDIQNFKEALNSFTPFSKPQ